MQLENLGKLERRLSIVVPLADVEKEVDTRLKRLSRTVRMAGFRPGKVPFKIVAQQYGYQTQSEVLNDKVGAAFDKAIGETQVRVAGTPRIEPRKGEEPAPEGELVFDATFEIYPEVKIAELKGVPVQRSTTEVSDAEVDKTLDILRRQRTHYHAKGAEDAHGAANPAPGELAAKSGDRVTIDFAGTLDGVPFQGGTASDFPFVLGEGRMLPEFEAAVTGLSTGESKVFPLTFPEDYHGKDVAGKTVEFTVTVKEVAWAHVPEIDDEFARSLGVGDGDLQKMRADVRTNLEREVEKRLRARTKESVMDALIARSELELPKVLVDAEVTRLADMAREDMKRRGMNVDNMPIPPELFTAQAERRVRLGLILAELVRSQDLQAKPDQVKAQVEDFAQSYEDPREVVRWYYSDRQRLAEVEALVLEENVVSHVLSLATVTEAPVAFDELMGGAGQG